MSVSEDICISIYMHKEKYVCVFMCVYTCV